MIKIESLFKEIESLQFSATLNLASGLSVARSILEQNITIQQLSREISNSSTKQYLVFKKLLTLLPLNPEPEYAHPHDAAIAAYLYVLSLIPSKLGLLAVEKVLQTPQLWWSRRLAKTLEIVKTAITSESTTTRWIAFSETLFNFKSKSFIPAYPPKNKISVKVS